MIRKILVAATLASFSAAPVMAGNASLKNAEGTKLRISCKSSGCKVTAKKKGGKWGTVEKTKGGRDNYLKLEAKYKAQGFN